ncbi:MAG: hypothetical protein IJ177_12695 [Fibrobacter sp.]|uniref:hypothetical protein n=1 Tax=Fibrobacter sp. TaxID=35828 RepID=UPI0025C62689|nr:hypothetical protein [Fibrobacter sp.]MBQ9227015.1 hypothetical protein [Fibrobacter sp.]
MAIAQTDIIFLFYRPELLWIRGLAKTAKFRNIFYGATHFPELSFLGRWGSFWAI